MKTHNLSEKKSVFKTDENVAALSTQAGLIISLSLMIYFLIMKAFNLHEILLLRYFNFIFLLTGILITFYQYRKKTGKKGIEYFTGMSLGMRISFWAVIPFAIFIGIYLAIDANFMTYVKHTAEFGYYLAPGIIAGGICIEGLCSGVIITFIAMQYFKGK